MWRFSDPNDVRAFTVIASAARHDVESRNLLDVLLRSILLPSNAPSMVGRSDDDCMAIIRRLTVSYVALAGMARKRQVMEVITLLIGIYFTGSSNEPALVELAEVVFQDLGPERPPSMAKSKAAPPRPPYSPRVCQLAGQAGVWTTYVDGDGEMQRTWWYTEQNGIAWWSSDGHTVQEYPSPARPVVVTDNASAGSAGLTFD
jgi:hypothetical protein